MALDRPVLRLLRRQLLARLGVDLALLLLYVERGPLVGGDHLHARLRSVLPLLRCIPADQLVGGQPPEDAAAWILGYEILGDLFDELDVRVERQPEPCLLRLRLCVLDGPQVGVGETELAGDAADVGIVQAAEVRSSLLPQVLPDEEADAPDDRIATIDSIDRGNRLR